MQSADILIIGGGIVGLSIARELKKNHRIDKVIVIEKEPTLGRHASGRNSGVLHSGIYYPSGSLKAQLCAQGAQEMAHYHHEHCLPLDRRGKVLVAVAENDRSQLELLMRRARENGVVAELLDQKQLRDLEPEARSACGSALWIPSTSVGSPGSVLETMSNEIVRLGIEIKYSACVTRYNIESKVVTLDNGDSISYGHLVNAAGLHADSVAHMCGVGHRYTLLPFKGMYWKLSQDSGLNVRHLIYPVPDLNVPFLGVHTTTTTDGEIFLGPTAVPALARENYHGLHGVTFGEMTRIIGLLSKQMMYGQQGFRSLAWQEGRRYFKRWFADAARSILPRLKDEHLLPSRKVGIRAQILDKHTGELVTDFLVERGASSTHILNAISPAWTSAFSFSRYVCSQFIVRS